MASSSNPSAPEEWKQALSDAVLSTLDQSWTERGPELTSEYCNHARTSIPAGKSATRSTIYATLDEAAETLCESVEAELPYATVSWADSLYAKEEVRNLLETEKGRDFASYLRHASVGQATVSQALAGISEEAAQNVTWGLRDKPMPDIWLRFQLKIGDRIFGCATGESGCNEGCTEIERPSTQGLAKLSLDLQMAYDEGTGVWAATGSGHKASVQTRENLYRQQMSPPSSPVKNKKK